MKQSEGKFCVIMLVMLMVIIEVNGIKRIDVGGKHGWDSKPFNYTQWASQETFYVGDWLLFRFDKYMYDVLEVNQTNYDLCKPENFIANITKGGKDVYELKEARPYYFICSKGYCFNGMKLAINVSEAPPPSPPPQGNYGTPQSSVILVSILAIFVFITLVA